MKDSTYQISPSNYEDIYRYYDGQNCVSLVCAVCTSVWCILVSSYWFGFNRSAGFETCRNAVTCYQRWFDVREIDSDLLLEVGLWRNLLDFLAHNTEMRGCDEVIVGLIGGERGKWIIWNASWSRPLDLC